MRLSDLIIEHGPWTDHDAAALLTLRITQGRAARELNELREELLAARKAGEERARFEIDGGYDYGHDITTLHCTRCRAWRVALDGPADLAELNRRAEEHAEVCR